VARAATYYRWRYCCRVQTSKARVSGGVPDAIRQTPDRTVRWGSKRLIQSSMPRRLDSKYLKFNNRRWIFWLEVKFSSQTHPSTTILEPWLWIKSDSNESQCCKVFLWPHSIRGVARKFVVDSMRKGRGSRRQVATSTNVTECKLHPIQLPMPMLIPMPVFLQIRRCRAEFWYTNLLCFPCAI